MKKVKNTLYRSLIIEISLSPSQFVRFPSHSLKMSKFRSPHLLPGLWHHPIYFVITTASSKPSLIIFMSFFLRLWFCSNLSPSQMKWFEGVLFLLPGQCISNFFTWSSLWPLSVVSILSSSILITYSIRFHFVPQIFLYIRLVLVTFLITVIKYLTKST